MNDKDKQKFVLYVATVLKENPEWFGDTVYAMQHGLSEALRSERANSSNLASGLVTMVSWEQKKNKKFPYYYNIQRALHGLRRWYEGAGVWKDIEPLLQDGDYDGQ